MFTPNGFVLEQCFHVWVPELSILNVWDIFQASLLACSCLYQSAVLITVLVFKGFHSATKCLGWPM